MTKTMASQRKLLFIFAGLVCIVLAIIGGIMYPPTSWGIITPVAYVLLVSSCSIALLRLIYAKGLPK
ncbi:MAG: hypothetical protein ACFFEK_00565 [Candidatus Thorarchaeota archaeon]